MKPKQNKAPSPQSALQASMAFKTGVGMMIAIMSGLTILSLCIGRWSIAAQANPPDEPARFHTEQGHNDASKPASLTKTIVAQQLEGSISHKTDLVMKDVKLNGNIHAGQSLEMDQSEVHGNISVGGSAHISNSKVLGNISIGKHGLIEQLDLQGNLSIRHHSTIRHLTMLSGTLATSSQNLRLDQSQVKKVRMAPRLTDHLYAKNGYHPDTPLELVAGSVLSIKGFHIQSTSDATTLRTPDGLVYENGQLIQGYGPSTYREYRQNHPKAPILKAPGWPTRSHTRTPNDNTKGPVLTLGKGTHITGQVIFDTGNGIVVVENGAKLSATVDGGTVQYHRPN